VKIEKGILDLKREKVHRRELKIKNLREDRGVDLL